MAANEKILLFCRRRGVRMLCAGILATLFVLFVIQMYHRADRENGYDLTSYLASARALISGGDPYNTGSPFPYIYPLFLAFILIPLVYIPYWLANLLWFIAGAASLWGIINRVGKSLIGVQFHYYQEYALVPLTILVLVFLNTIQNNLLNGQVNIILIFLCVLGMRWSIQGKEISAGLIVAAAAAIKLTPSIFVLYFLIERQYKAVAAMILGVAIYLFLPFLCVGPRLIELDRNYFETLYAHSVASASNEGLTYSLSGVLARLIPGFAHQILTALSLILVVGATAALHLAKRNGTRSSGTVFLFSLYFLAMLLSTPISETHHLIMLLIPACAVLLWTLFGKDEAPFPGFRLAAFTVMYLLGSGFETLPFYFFAILLAGEMLLRLADRLHVQNNQTSIAQ